MIKRRSTWQFSRRPRQKSTVAVDRKMIERVRYELTDWSKARVEMIWASPITFRSFTARPS